jgi:hypothetical protein
MFSKIHKPVFAIAALIFSVSCLIFVLKYQPGTANAVSSHTRGMPTSGTVFTSSNNGRTLYQWKWSRKTSTWIKTEYKSNRRIRTKRKKKYRKYLSSIL